MNSLFEGWKELMASFTRRTLIVITAPIFNNFSLIVPAVATASSVPFSPNLRSASTST